MVDANTVKIHPQRNIGNKKKGKTKKNFAGSIPVLTTKNIFGEFKYVCYLCIVL